MLDGAKWSDFTGNAVKSRKKPFYIALAGTMALFSLAGCSKTSPTPDEHKVVAGETYEEFGQRRDALKGSQGSIAGQGCTQDCGGHEAGYAWAERNGITDPGQCGGSSWSFIEGCRAYADEAVTKGEWGN